MWAWPRSVFTNQRELWKKIIKCVVAYEISIILIIIPKVGNSVGAVPYLITLGTLFFNPSSTAGNQVVEIMLNILAAVPAMIWCAIVSYLCTLYNKARIEDGVALYANGAGVIAALGFFICVLVSAYYRLKYPRLFVPMLQAFIIPFFGLTRNIYNTSYSVMYILSIFYPVLIGGGVALLVNIFMWPETAARASEKSLGNAIQSIRQVMVFVNDELLKNDGQLAICCDMSASKQLRKLYDKLQDDIASMHKSQQEAKYELVVSHYAPRWFKPLVRLIEDLSKSMYGFSLAIERELRIMVALRQSKQTEQAKEYTSFRTSGIPTSSAISTPTLSNVHYRHTSSQDNTENLTVFKQLKNSNRSQTHLSFQQGEGYRQLNRLQRIIQPGMKQFISCCICAIDKIDSRLADNNAIPFHPQQHPNQYSVEHEPSAASPTRDDDVSLLEALEEFKKLEVLLESEYQQGVTSPGEDKYLIYTILFTLHEIGKGLNKLEGLAEVLVQKREGGRWPRLFFPKVPLSKWMSKAAEDRHRTPGRWQGDVQRTLASESSVSPRYDYEADGSTDNETTDVKNSNRKEDEYGEIRTMPLQHAPRLHLWSRWLHNIVHWFREGPTRYAIKFAITMELLAMMAWIPGANDLYNNNHGQWALLSAMVVFNFTVGSTAIQCFFRVVATIIGAVTGYISLLAAHRNENPYVLAVMILIFQVPFWYILLGSKYPRIGFISLLTLAVISMTGYNDTLDEDLFSPVWKRTVTAIFAIIVVMVVNQLLWPVWARKVLRIHLSDLLIATGIQFSRVASLVSQGNVTSPIYVATLNECQYNEKRLARQVQLTRQMLILAADEPRFTKGRFPIEVYREILHHEQNILYWIKHLMIVQALISPLTRQKIMLPMNSCRKELAAAVHLYLFTLGGSLRTKSSLPASLPSAELPRQLLQTRQSILWKENYEDLSQLQAPGEAQRKSAENQVYWQTYADGTIEVIVEQESMGVLVANLMGQHVFRHWTGADCK